MVHVMLANFFCVFNVRQDRILASLFQTVQVDKNSILVTFANFVQSKIYKHAITVVFKWHQF